MLRRLSVIVLSALLILAASSCESRRTPSEIAASYLPNRAVALCLIRAESGGNQYAVSPTSDYGLFQINSVHRRQFEAMTGKPWRPWIFNPDLNGMAARAVYNAQGYRAWSTHRKCGV